MPTARELRTLAWEDLKREGNYGSYVRAQLMYVALTILVYMIAAVPVLAGIAVFGSHVGWTREQMAAAMTDSTTFAVGCLALTLVVVAAVSIVFWFICWMKWGFARLALSCVRGRGDRREIYRGRQQAWRMLDLLCWQGVYVFLWSLLLIVPGILAQLSYSQAEFLLVEHPEWTPRECLAESKKMMYGHRWRYFRFRLSFIGWYLLNALLAAAVSSVTGLGGLVSVFFNPYFDCGGARFYDDLAVRQRNMI